MSAILNLDIYFKGRVDRESKNMNFVVGTFCILTGYRHLLSDLIIKISPFDHVLTPSFSEFPSCHDNYKKWVILGHDYGLLFLNEYIYIER